MYKSLTNIIIIICLAFKQPTTKQGR